MATTTPSDAELLTRTRHGDRAAFTELYIRHGAAARRLATTYARAAEPDDLVNEAFERVLNALERGSGPDDAFRAYLFVTVRRLASDIMARRYDEPMADVPEPVRANADDPAFEQADRQIVLTAYGALPERWQSVLWHTAVEGREPRDLAPMFGVSANAAAALAYRARESLRQAYLQAHLQVAPRPQCEPHRSRLGAYVRDGLSQRHHRAAEAHISGCDSCSGLVAELTDINRLLAGSLAPVFVSAGEIAAVATGGAVLGGGAVAGGLNAARRLGSKARSNPAVVAGGILATAALAAALVASLGGGDSAPEAAAPPEPDSEEVAPSDDASSDAAPPAPPDDTPADVAPSRDTPADQAPDDAPASEPAPAGGPAPDQPSSPAAPSDDAPPPPSTDPAVTPSSSPPSSSPAPAPPPADEPAPPPPPPSEPPPPPSPPPPPEPSSPSGLHVVVGLGNLVGLDVGVSTDPLGLSIDLNVLGDGSTTTTAAQP